MLQKRVSVGALAEFAHLSGDLRPAQQGAERMQEGLRGHQMRQGGYPPGFEKEVPLRLTRQVGPVRLTVYGRCDGLCRHSVPPLVEEIKTTRLDPQRIDPAQNPAHWAQALLYAHMLAQELGAAQVKTRLVYMDLSGAHKDREEVLDAAALEDHFLGCALPYARWQAQLEAAREKMLPTLRALSFPYPDYRPGQRELAAQTYLALKRHNALLAQAPTGIGKTAAVLFAALKALGEGHVNRVFYLTARTTARQAAESALARMRRDGLWLRAITLTAKEKLCPLKEAGCDPSLCHLAQGYYDRRGQALEEALDLDSLTRERVLALAQRHQLCPFEMQLDIAENCDVVICDYNYAFDPRVRLKRFFQEKFDGALLIDEAHNLLDRAREMLSAQVRLSDFRRLAAHLKKLAGPEDGLLQRINQVVQALKDLKESHPAPDWDEEAPQALEEALQLFLDAARPLLGAAGALNQSLTQLYFDGMNFVRVAGEMGPGYRALYLGEERDMAVRLWCFAPASYLGKALGRTRGAALFSATLVPLSHYMASLGLDEDRGDAQLDLPSPFPEENLCVLRMPLATTLRRREESAPQVAQAILALCRAHKGNYLACFPSYAYLNLVGKYLAPQAQDMDLMAQRPNMSEAEREAFIAAFTPERPRPLLALAVMGGVFAEGIDLPGERLSGAAIVGVGFPQISLERAALAAALEESGEPGDGLMGAYVYPGLQRVLQAAGRVIRGEEDRGAVLLIDERYFQPAYEAYLPGQWQVRDALTVQQAARHLAHFWAT
ncbi:MAG TPA: DEAD/DEAH box helicase family protein [Candidatus Excrementavichristensenella intestinipullorum]|nr:DEAD/DEAH box helicase family protein [Candidatus Excrementavichristensenella intestinipullorum]